jgi:hypothetical protein
VSEYSTTVTAAVVTDRCTKQTQETKAFPVLHLTTVHPYDEAAKEQKFIQLEQLGATHQHSPNYPQQIVQQQATFSAKRI